MTGPVGAQVGIHETEPNDTPETANRIDGAVRVLGSMPAGDQDGFLWTVSDVDARKRWSFELEGIPGALTVLEVIRLQYAEDGSGVADREVLLRLGSRDGSRPAGAEDLLFEPGDYLLGVARAGGNAPFRPPVDSVSFEAMGPGAAPEAESGGYRLTIREGRDFGVTPSAAENSSRDKALAVRPGRGHLGYAAAEDGWFEIEVSEAQAQQSWDLTAQVPVGRSVRLALFDAQGRELSGVSGGRRGQARLPELSLEAGQYRAHVKAEPETLRFFALEEGGVRVAGAEAEPNDKWQTANRVDLGQALTGRFQRKGDTDFFLFELTPESAEQRLLLEAAVAGGNGLTFCLLDHRGEELQCRSGTGQVRLEDISLHAGEYGLSLGRGQEGVEYSVTLAPAGPHEPGVETEPNDSVALATGMPANQRIKGRIDKDDIDFFRIVVDGEPQLWRFQVVGDGVHEVAYHDGAGREAQKIRGQAKQRRITLDNLFLMPGVHYVGVSGREDGDYTLLTRPLGPPDPNGEREPNDDPTRMLPLRIGQVRTGLLSDPADRDNYRFHLAHHDHIRLTMRPAADGAIRAQLYWDGVKTREASAPDGQPLVIQGLFPPGDYRLELITGRPSEAEYQLDLERLERFACAVDCEPNDNPAFARPVPRDGGITGEVGEWRDEDWYALPVADRDVALALESEQKLSIDMVARAGERGGLERDSSGARYVGTIPAGEQRYLRIRGQGRYDMRVVLDDGEARAPAPMNMALALEFDTRAVAAYQPYGQRLTGTLELSNEGTAVTTVALEAVTSNARWQVSTRPGELRIEPGASATAEVRVAVPDDAWADRPVRISVQAADGQGGAVETYAEIDVDRDAPLAAPERHWDVPDALLGGLNVAWQALGGRWTGEEDGKIGQGLGQIFDGMAVRGEGLSLRSGNDAWVYQSTVVLAGDGPVEVAGIALNPLGRDSTSAWLRRFALALSDDGVTFRRVLDGILEPQPREQYFVLPEPTQARFARLDFIDDYNGHQGGSRGLGEWKVIARPGADVSAGVGLNLADPALGGHVAWARPVISQRWDDDVLQPESRRTRVRLRAGKHLEWVVGFHHNRAAQITALEWLHSPDGNAAERIARVEVAVSVDSPLGPWSPIGSWAVDGPGEKRLALDAPTWARFVRFSTPAAERDVFLEAPGAVRIIEHSADDSYRSILGEWGATGGRAMYEALQPIAPARAFEPAAHGSRPSAAPLEPGKTVDGQVLLGRHEHWYRLQVPAGQNTLLIRLAGEPTVRTVLALETASGEPLPLRPIERRSDLHRMEAVVEPGSTVYLHVSEPPRNVVFAWDTSASVGAFLPVIYGAMAAYARDLVPGRDAANLMPFGAGLLMQDWHGEPYLVQTILNEYPRGESSSAAEGTLRRASEALGRHAGTKAVVLITDAATGREPQMWNSFERVRPRIFSLGLDSTGALGRYPAREQDLLQDWARVNGGHYAHVGSEGEMEVAFDRAATMLRGSAPYQLTVDAEFREALGPGTLEVRSGDGAGLGSGGVLFILDASGSMLQRIDGRRRIEIAREVLVEAATRNLQPGTPVALRVFGHREPNACRTDLEIPLQPLDPAKAGAVIGRVEARNLARTPIADSIAKAESDLARATGPKTIVLLTDGEETCDGDPEAVITALVDKGFDMRLNIVGFALGDEALESQFEAWAELGGGRYFKADDENGLGHALAEALRTPYAVYDYTGLQVAEGIVDGERLELPAGTYSVLVKTSPPQTLEGIDVYPGDSASLLLR
ncbi:VWA domain-containing protein [Thioalkalivibrio sp. XN279]|uniref:VWA domain-containing protein n=1 Tax=Thioalkalivibrio sp. XN279 TaxID=2714953 RepID=UPI00140D105D|nr:VWA domain-containing protein [Thioalkalivibrio sp. XN279]NHA14674.1 VWA domain-containing protein [Thioalkalivibrio sp. XN279]